VKKFKKGWIMETEVYKTTTALTIEPRIAVVGIGGAGCNAVNDIYWADGSFDIIAINTDEASLKRTMADKKICLCKNVTKGEGAKGDLLLAERCAKAHIDEIKKALEGYDSVFVVAGMGGGTGTGVAPTVLAAAHSLDLMAFVIAIKPFSFEMNRTKVAREGIAKLNAMCPMTVVIENEKVLTNLPNATMDEAFRMVNESIVEYITEKRTGISEIMGDQIGAIGTMVDEAEDPHSLSFFTGGKISA
jgi:cell division protein FtsZ